MSTRPRRAPRQQMPKAAPAARARSFEEVALGFDREQAVLEARRCLQCKHPTCQVGCPVMVDIREFVRAVAEEDLARAVEVLKANNSLPAICGRVCPQESQCERVCLLAKRDDPLAIGALERFVADWEADHPGRPARPRLNGGPVAVVGSGPAGLTAAAQLVRLGHPVTVFEGLHLPGGVLVYGIPEFRLPREILRREVEYVRSLGAQIEPNVLVGKTVTIPELFGEGYRAVFVGTGAGLPYFMGIPGENSLGVYSSNEFLTRLNLMKAFRFPEYDTPIRVGRRVAVVGAGNTAMDAARCSLRVGAEEVYLVYRRSEAEMPARREEVENAREEGVRFHLLTNPVRVHSDADGWVKALECVRMELGEPDQSGRRRPIPVPGSEFLMPVETVVVAVGQGVNPLLARETPGLQTGKDGILVTDPETCMTTVPGVFAGGDSASNAGTVIAAMGDGLRAAHGIHQWLDGG